uniref:Uncharacterized protein n=1 Tax=Anguilla anguilla TaxID=7936 RepID=A0A0E9RTP4_ANGAN
MAVLLLHCDRLALSQVWLYQDLPEEGNFIHHSYFIIGNPNNFAQMVLYLGMRHKSQIAKVTHANANHRASHGGIVM